MIGPVWISCGVKLLNQHDLCCRCRWAGDFYRIDAFGQAAEVDREDGVSGRGPELAHQAPIGIEDLDKEGLGGVADVRVSRAVRRVGLICNVSELKVTMTVLE
jgi:hypothetical protein